ncbi:pyridoxine 5'-phosphate synthase [Rariglobus hedericola]|uniref:Pyridoxine 5'-phosphate synthase n=1 Tax=Rariglobus hedericola TaxID=2597822 RepID=A0A556QKW1_9BACT|nr:pyridoxine 5'-phosphate synthase [Rariglobus hedericola]TSJ77276.1 pyridoxine 5'-phosphate synthase [Rariglobus hedericola]
MILLGVNIDHCATVRQARYRGYDQTAPGPVEPDPVALAVLAERAGADGITIHLREDRRHIQEHDVWRLKAASKTRINLEMACTPWMIDFALKVKPASVCVVPESREEISTEGGLDVVARRAQVKACVDAMNAAGIITSLFIDADAAQIDLSAELGAPWIELHTGAWANVWHTPRRAEEFARLRDGALRAHAAGVVVNAGHGINYDNVAEIRTLPHVHELNIGHTIISRALTTGIDEAVREMKKRMNPAT